MTAETTSQVETTGQVVLAGLASKVNRTTTSQPALPSPATVPVDADKYLPQLSRRFEILERLRADSTGIVYKVYDSNLDRIAAVKVLPYLGLSQSVEARFVRDFKALTSLDHPNILKVYDYGKTLDGAPYMVMEHFDGKDLASIIDRLQLLSPERAEIIFLQLTEALGYAHRQGVIHRDIKPSNVLVLLDSDGNQTVKLIDFGISRTVAENIPDHLKLCVDHRGKLYSSPEQTRGNVFDSRSDLYSLGCLMYEVLAGRSPFKDADEVLNKQPLPLRGKKSKNDIPERLDYCISRCLEKEASARFKDADALFYQLTSAIANSDRPKLRPSIPWLLVVKALALCSTAILPLIASKSFEWPLWSCLTVYGLILALVILSAVKNQDLSYRLRSRSELAPRELETSGSKASFE